MAAGSAADSAHPVVIVGAGPTGACLALLLARRGLPVVLVEASSSPERQFRGEALMPHGLAVLEAMGLLPLPASIPQRPLAGWRFLLNGRELFRLDEPLEAAPGPPCTLISQPALLQHLLTQLRRHPQVQLREGERVQGLLWQGERVTGVRLADGQPLAAALVVAADGRGSLLRQQAGLALQTTGRPFELLWFQLATPEPDPLGGLFTTLVGADGLFSAFAGSQGTVQIGWLLRRGEPGRGGGGQASAAAGLERLAAQSPADLAPWWRQQRGRVGAVSRLQVRVGHAERWWRPGLLLLGDAAHPMSPVRAQGINLALRDAWVAAQELAPPGQERVPLGAELDAALARIEQRRRGEVATLQALQEREARRGQLLLAQPALRTLLAAAAPWAGTAVARRWRHDQRLLRQGVTPLEPQR